MQMNMNYASFFLTQTVTVKVLHLSSATTLVSFSEGASPLLIGRDCLLNTPQMRITHTSPEYP